MSTRYVQHISKTGPIEEVLYDTGDDFWGYWIVRRTPRKGVSCEAMLWKQDYVLVEKPVEWEVITPRVWVEKNGVALATYPRGANCIPINVAQCEPGFRFRHTSAGIQIEYSS